MSDPPWRRDASDIHAGLAAWAGRYGAEVADVHMPGNGMSNDTVLFTLAGDPVVARLAPPLDSPFPTFPVYDFEFEHRAIDLVRTRTAVPVPDIVYVETDGQWLGVPFMVMRAVDGLVPADNPPYLIDPNGWFLQGTPDDWRRLEESSIDLLVQLHRIADDGDDTAFLRLDLPGDTALARQLSAHRRYYDWARDGHTVPILERAFERLDATLPANASSVLNWGDGRPGNIIYLDFEPVAALDWEMAGVGPREVDVAWMTFFQRFWASMAAQWGFPPVPAMFDREATAATYERLGGRPLEDLAWYEALAGLRFGIILARMSLRSIAFGVQQFTDNPDDLILFAPLLERLLADL